MSQFLSYKTGKPIAIYKNDDQRKIIRLTEEKEEARKVDNISSMLSDKEMKQITAGLTTRDMINLERAITLENRPVDSILASRYDIIKELINDKRDREISTVEGDYIPYPQRNDIIYLIGATGSGKSTSIRRYLIEFKKAFPEVKKFFLFTDNEVDDPVLDGLGIKKFILNEKIWQNPIKPVELHDSVVIFDDVDSIQDKKIHRAIVDLKASCMKQGVSKNDITCIVTNHDACEGLSTKATITNAKYIYVYSQGGTTGLDYLYKKLGLTKEQIKKLKSLKSRTTIIHKRFPFYVIHTHGVFLL